jgi:hypothetical protein
MRSCNHHLGIVYAPDEKSAEPAAVQEFKIDDQRHRLVVREQE